MTSPRGIDDLKAALAESPDVTADERLRVLAHAWIVRVLSVVAMVPAFPLAFMLAGMLMMWLDGIELTQTRQKKRFALPTSAVPSATIGA